MRLGNCRETAQCLPSQPWRGSKGAKERRGESHLSSAVPGDSSGLGDNHMDEAPASRIWERSSNEFMWMGVVHTELELCVFKKKWSFFGGGVQCMCEYFVSMYVWA